MSKGMQSLRELYKIGRGPSSSHTIGPERACNKMKQKYPQADSFEVILYGSLAMTGEGHGTDSVMVKTFTPLPVKVVFDPDKKDLPHANTMDMIAYKDGAEIGRERIMSVGGGTIRAEGEEVEEIPLVYTLSTFEEISEYCASKRMRLWEYVVEVEKLHLRRPYRIGRASRRT